MLNKDCCKGWREMNRTEPGESRKEVGREWHIPVKELRRIFKEDLTW